MVGGNSSKTNSYEKKRKYNLLRIISLYFFIVISIIFAILGFIIPIIKSSRLLITYKSVVYSSICYLITIFSIFCALVIYDDNNMYVAVLFLVLTLPLLGIRILMSYISFTRLQKYDLSNIFASIINTWKGTLENIKRK